MKVITRGGKPITYLGKLAVSSVGNCCGNCASGTGTGACCFTDGHCEELTSEECANAGGTFNGSGTSCDPNPCTVVCCETNGTCSVITLAECLEIGTVVDAEDCTPNPCTGACCDAGVCSVETPDDCETAGGAFIGYGTDCTGVDCSCCPWFTENGYTTITLSGTITGCPNGTITIPEQTWTLNNVLPALLSVNEFSLFGCTFNAVSACLGLANAIAADEDGSCNNILVVDWVGFCTNKVGLSGLVNNFLCGCTGGCGSGGPVEHYLTGSTFAFSVPDSDPTVTYNFILSFA